MTIPKLYYISLPNSFCVLLKNNMQSRESIHSKLKLFVERYSDLYGLISRGMSDIDEFSRVDRILSSLGWLGLRDRLAAHYFHYQKNKYYLNAVETTRIESLLTFEKKAAPYTVDGFSRAFMLSFYLEMMHSQLENIVDYNDLFSISSEVYDLLPLYKTRTVNIDWIILTLEHLVRCFSVEKIKAAIIDGGDFQHFISSMDREQRHLYFTNMLIYGASIGDQEVFTSELMG